jgi:hypothetical protein
VIVVASHESEIIASADFIYDLPTRHE